MDVGADQKDAKGNRQTMSISDGLIDTTEDAQDKNHVRHEEELVEPLSEVTESKEG